MKAWYLDDSECRCTLQILRELGVRYWYLPLESADTSAALLEQLKNERGFKGECPVDVSRAALGDGFEARRGVWFREHSLAQEECLVVADGGAFVDVRDGASQLWVRIQVAKGDALALPAGLMRRVVLVPSSERLVARCLFKSSKSEPAYRYPAPHDPREVCPHAYGAESLSGERDPRAVIPEICAQFYQLGWVSGTGGGMAIRHGSRYFMAPSGVMKERLTPEVIYVLDSQGTVLEAPRQHPAQAPLKLSECSPLFMHAFDLRGAGAVLHSHSLNVVMATLLDESADEFVVSHQEMIKGVAGHRYDEPLVVPIIENTPRESNLADLLAAAIKAYPRSPAVMVRRHGIYVWGKDWRQAKTQAECLDYLCAWACAMKKAGLHPAHNPFTAAAAQGKLCEAWLMDPCQEAAGVDCREAHRRSPNVAVSKAALDALGVEQWKLDADKYETDPQLAALRQARGYSYQDLITITPEKLPNYEAKIQSFFEEHLHTDDEIRYVLDGSGYFDVRTARDDAWVRIHMKKGDLITLPAGIYHRFTLDRRQYIKAMRLFVGEPVWTAHNRSPAADAMPARALYTAALATKASTSTSSTAAAEAEAATDSTKKRSAASAGLGGGGPGGMPSIGDYVDTDAGANSLAAAAAAGKRARPTLRHKYTHVVLDIEGTTTPVAFVHQTLFPYAKAHVAAHLAREWDTAECRADVALLRAQAAMDRADPALLAQMPGLADVAAAPTAAAAGGGSHGSNAAADQHALVAYVHWCIAHDRKVGALKALQGHIWKRGYERGELRGAVYDDVAPALARWQAQGVPVYIYSSGSCQAQRLIFGYSEKGDLKKYLAGYFDTKVGQKKDAASYSFIAETIGAEDRAAVLFATDLLAEADAAAAAGMEAVLVLRPGNHPLDAHNFPTAHSFDELFASGGQ